MRPMRHTMVAVLVGLLTFAASACGQRTVEHSAADLLGMWWIQEMTVGGDLFDFRKKIRHNISHNIWRIRPVPVIYQCNPLFLFMEPVVTGFKTDMKKDNKTAGQPKRQTYNID